MKAGLLQLVPPAHTGKIRAHRHTSYAGLTFALLVTGVLLLGASWASEAAVPAVNPQAGSVGLNGTVRGPAPTTAAAVLAPHTGTTVDSTPVTISGSCPAGTFVTITKNNAFAGVVPCDDDGTFSLQIDLFDGANTIIAQVSDALGQLGPPSQSIEIFYNAPSLGAGNGTVGRQLFLQTGTTVLATDPNVNLSRSINIVGGVGPYAVAWDFGDGETSLVSQAGEGTTSAGHVYKRAGTYRVIVRVTDSLGNAAFLQLVTVVNGPVTALGSSQGKGLGALPGQLIAAWPLYLLALAMVLLFWLGERREIQKLRHRGLPV